MVVLFGRSAALAAPGADLRFKFTCGQASRDATEDAIQAFLAQRPFKMVNMGRLTRQHGGSNPETIIAGLAHDRKSFFSIGSATKNTIEYSFELYSRPPTHHASEFETAVLAFVAKDLNCTIADLRRGDNDGEEAVEFYDQELQLVEHMFIIAGDRSI